MLVKCLVAFLLWTSVGWAQEAQPLQPVQPAQVGAAPAAAGKGQPVVEKEIEVSAIRSYLAPFVYDMDQLRDPFETQGSSAPLEPGQVYGPFLPVQSHRLSDYKLKGLLWKTDQPIAVFQGPKDKEFRLAVKDYIGENFGYVATIREKEVVVIQTIEENQKRYSTTKVIFLNE